MPVSEPLEDSNEIINIVSSALLFINVAQAQSVPCLSKQQVSALHT